MSIYHVACDEAYSDGNNRYLVLGGVFMTKEMTSTIGANISRWKDIASLSEHTFHWTKLTPRNAMHYKHFVNGSVSNCQRRRMRYRSLIVDKRHISLADYHDGDRERGFYSFVNTFIFNCFVKELGAQDRLHVYWHKRDTPFALDELKTRLNNRYMLRTKSQVRPVVSVEHAPADGHHFIQIADVLNGIIGCDINEKANPHSKRGAAKYDLVKHLLGRVRMDTFKETRSSWRSHFTTWHFDFDAVRKRKDAPKPSGKAAI
ncbi:MAG: DUF3800 domain-containing protein [Planctomycetes bacterium]|nr:DUF3800 domain-containing protein [Planctomycetota bacterium]